MESTEPIASSRSRWRPTSSRSRPSTPMPMPSSRTTPTWSRSVRSRRHGPGWRRSTAPAPTGTRSRPTPRPASLHVPGGRSYARTEPERCYATPEDAEADGFRRASCEPSPEGGTMKVVVDFDVCASTGSCMQVCPEVFEVRSDGYLYILQEEPAPELHDKVRGRRPVPDGGDLAGGVSMYAQLRRGWTASGSMLCVGLDPDPRRFRPGWRRRGRVPRSAGRSSTLPRPGLRVQAAVRPLRRGGPSRRWNDCVSTSVDAPRRPRAARCRAWRLGSTAEHYATRRSSATAPPR